MLTDTLDLPFAIKSADFGGNAAHSDGGTIEGYGAVYGALDRDGDIIAPGAFTESLKGRAPLMLWQHNAREPIGIWERVEEDANGLKLVGKLARSGRGGEASELVRMGALTGLSVGFITREATRDKLTGVRTIIKADLFEVSLVTFPANDAARIRRVKQAGADVQTVRDLERTLKQLGTPARLAKQIASRFEPKAPLRRPVEDFRALKTALEDSIRLLEG